VAEKDRNGNAPVQGGESPEQNFGMRIARDGTWYHQGSPIGRKPLVKLFASVLQRDNAGDYWLVTSVERGQIEVEDAPFMAVELTVAGQGMDQDITFRTNVDDLVVADKAHPLRIVHDSATGEPAPYILVRDRLEARLARSVYYHLADLCVERRVGGRLVLGVWSGGAFFILEGEEIS
jgi:hypothetical protein